MLLASLLLVLAAPRSRATDGKFWLTCSLDRIDADLVGVQAVVVKDEDTPEHGCRRSDVVDARVSDKRYLMCAGSILTGRHVLTSASCVREATHVRHNVRAPLAVLVAPFSDTAQLIKVSEHRLHPNHALDPRDEHHAQHDVAVLKLACRIFKSNLRKIELPTQPLVDECDEESCLVAVIRRTDRMLFTMYETRAGNVVTTEMQNKGHWTDKNVTNQASSEKPREYFEPDESDAKFTIDIPEQEEEEEKEEECTAGMNMTDKNNDESLSKNSLTTNDQREQREKKLRPRSSHGASGCPHTGSPVMLDKTQYGIVSSSCDDRQPDVAWRYTDLFENVDWIESIVNPGIKKPVDTTCNSCVYNINLEFGCQDQCRGSRTTVCGLEGVRLPGIELPGCPGNQTEIITVGRREKGGSPESVESLQERLKKMAYEAYLARLGDFKSKEQRNDYSPKEEPLPEQVAALYRQFLEEYKRAGGDNRGT